MALAAVCLELSGVGGQCLTGSRSFPSQCLFIDDDGSGNCVDGAGEIFANQMHIIMQPSPQKKSLPGSYKFISLSIPFINFIHIVLSLLLTVTCQWENVIV